MYVQIYQYVHTYGTVYIHLYRWCCQPFRFTLFRRMSGFLSVLLVLGAFIVNSMIAWLLESRYSDFEESERAVALASSESQMRTTMQFYVFFFYRFWLDILFVVWQDFTFA